MTVAKLAEMARKVTGRPVTEHEGYIVIHRTDKIREQVDAR